MSLRKQLYRIFSRLFNEEIVEEIEEAERCAFSAGVRISNEVRESLSQSKETMMQIAVNRDLKDLGIEPLNGRGN